MKSLFLALLVSVVLGAAYLFTRNGPESGSEAVGPDGPGAAVAEAPVPSDSPELESVEAGDDAGRDQAPATTLAPKANAPDSPAADVDDAALMATVRGRITDVDGVGLADGEVEANAPFGVLTMGPRDEAIEADAGADGAFELTVRAGDYRVHFGVDGYAPLSQSVHAGAGQIVELGDVRLPAGVRISGRVMNDRGLPVEGASVHRPVETNGGLIQLGALGATVATTDAGGHFEILRQAAGSFEFSVDHPDHIRGSFEGSTKIAGEVAHGIEVTLAQGVSIAGNVLDVPADVEASSLWAFARLERSGGAGVAFSMDLGGMGAGGSRSAAVMDDGSFLLRGLKPEARYEVWVQATRRVWGSGSRRSARVSAASGETDVRVAYHHGATLLLSVHDQAGASLTDPTIRGGFGFERNFEDTLTDAASGTHALRHLWPTEKDTSFNLTIEARGFETFTRKGIMIVPGGEVDLGVITLQPKPQLEVTVLDAANGQPVEGARVSVKQVADASASGTRMFSRTISANVGDGEDLGDLDFSMFGKQVQTTDEEGKCTLDVEPGTSVHIDVIHAGFAETRSDPVRIGDGAPVTESTVKLLPGGSVTVLVNDASGNPLPGARIERRDEDGRPSPSKATTGKDGTALLTGLAPGVHGLRLAKKKPRGGVIVLSGMGGPDTGSPWTEVSVEPGQTASAILQAEPPRHITGTITEAGTPLAGAKVSLQADSAMPGFPGLLGGGASATTDARGRFRLEDVEGGKSKLVISHATRAMDYEHPFEVEPGENEVNLDLGVTIVEGVVLDHEGEPLAGAKVKVGRKESSGSRTMVSFVMATDGGDGAGETFISGGPTEPDAVFTDGEGRYTVRGVQAGVSIAVTATADGYDKAESEPFEVDAGEVRGGVDLAFVLTGSLKIQVEGGMGRTIAILRRRGESIRDPRIESFSGESTTIDGLAPGTWVVRLNSMGGGDARFSPEELEVEVAAGETAEASFERSDR